MKVAIRLRVAFYVTLSFAIVIVALSYAISELYEGYSYRSLDVTLQAAASSVANRVADIDLHADLKGVREDIAETVGSFENKIGVIHVGIFDPSSSEVISLNDADSIALKAKAESGRKFRTVKVRGKLYRAAFAEFEIPDNAEGMVVAVCSLAPLHESIDRIRGLVFIVAPITIILVGIGSVKIARRALKPLERMASDIDRIDVGSQTMRLRVPDTNDEITRVAESFNALMERVVTLIDTQRNFLMDASHELKTPLTVIQAEIEMLQMKRNLTGEEKENLRHLVAEVEYASKLAVDLIYLSRLESAEVSPTPVNLAAVVREVVSHHNTIARRKKVSIHLEMPEKCVVNGDAELLKRALSNVTENAIKYSHDGGQVLISGLIKKETMRIELTVEDNGPGIAADELPRVFDRFYRTRSARGGDEKGSGLGLSITRRIVQQHNGEISVKSEPGKGTAVSIRLPITT
jgi:signal transduction histidine kinase